MRLTNLSGFDYSWYSHSYITTQHRKFYDEISAKIISFKCGEVSAVDFFLNVVKGAFANRGLAFDYVIRALSSEELTASDGQPMDKVGELIASLTNSIYRNDLICKSHVIPQFITLKTLQERERVIRNVYSATQELNIDKKRVLIIDDVITTGTTLLEIRRSLHSPINTISFNSYCLAKSSHNDNSNIAFELGIDGDLEDFENELM